MPKHTRRYLTNRKLRKAITARVAAGGLTSHAERPDPATNIAEVTSMYERLAAIVNPTTERTSS